MATGRGTSRDRRGIRVVGFGCVVGVLVALGGAGAAANASIIDRDRYTRTYEEVRWDCGYPMNVAGSETHQVQVRADNKVDGIVYVTDNFDSKEVWTAADGTSFNVSAHALFKDVRAKPVGGSVYEFTFHGSGQPLTITDASGAVLARDRGSFSFSYTIDLATGEFNDTGEKISGPHPIGPGMCKVVASLAGSDSARHLTAKPLGSTPSALGYYEYLPPSYRTAGTKSPLLVAVHGYGETGDGTPDTLNRVIRSGIPRFIDVGGWPTDRPLVVLAPQHVEEPPGFDFTPCNGIMWGGSCSMQLQHDRGHTSPTFCATPQEVHDFIAYAVAHYNVDPHRVYLTGLSCGGFGAWDYLAAYHDQVAAAVPVAGEGRPAWATAGCALGTTAIWAFHGERDPVVNPQGSIQPMTNLAACPGIPPDRARLTVYPGLMHEGWDQAYSGSLGDDIYTWMLGISKP